MSSQQSQAPRGLGRVLGWALGVPAPAGADVGVHGWGGSSSQALHCSSHTFPCRFRKEPKAEFIPIESMEEFPVQPSICCIPKLCSLLWHSWLVEPSLGTSCEIRTAALGSLGLRKSCVHLKIHVLLPAPSCLAGASAASL